MHGLCSSDELPVGLEEGFHWGKQDNAIIISESRIANRFSMSENNAHECDDADTTIRKQPLAQPTA